MGTLTGYLQREFARHCPPGWRSHHEVPLLSRELERLLGYAPRADVVLEQPGGARRLWIEFEVSRADPVANHAKFATAHLFQPQPETDCFVAMVSAHVSRGRRNLAASTVALMRRIGMNAFQTVLFPQLSGAQVQRLNHLDLNDGIFAGDLPPIAPEIERALSISSRLIRAGNHRIHLAGDLLDVLLNVRRWNDDMATPAGQDLWGRRTVTYFVFDPSSATFAPAKFCAYVPLPNASPSYPSPAMVSTHSVMTIPLYVTLDSPYTRFDGHRARVHLQRSLAMPARPLADAPALAPPFRRWLARFPNAIQPHPAGPILLTPPSWFR